MKLKEIPMGTVVHTSTERDADELLAILHENGYKWNGGDSLIEDNQWERYKSDTCYHYGRSSRITFGDKKIFTESGFTILSLAEFKAKYALDEANSAKSETLTQTLTDDRKSIVIVQNGKLLPEFSVGDKVEFQKSYYKEELHGEIGVVTRIIPPVSYYVEVDNTIYPANATDLLPYTEPETKPTENMEIKGLNLCELLRGHEGETFFSLAHGEVVLDHISPTLDSCIVVKKRNDKHFFYRNGQWLKDGVVMLFPSRDLYEKYSLDAYAAWMEWKKKIDKRYSKKIGREIVRPLLNNIKPAYRSKVLKEIRAIIEKYSR